MHIQIHINLNLNRFADEDSEGKGEFNSKEFLGLWQKDYHKKEKELDKITEDLTRLSKQIGYVNKAADDPKSIPRDPI